MTPERRVSLDALGAWLIKCKRRRTPLEPFLAAGRTKPNWCVADNYRSRLMRPGHPVLFWVSAHPRRGLWGAGHVTGQLASEGGQLHVPVSIPLFGEPLTAAELSAVPGLHTMKVFRAPQQANPSWVSSTELTLIERHRVESRQQVDRLVSRRFGKLQTVYTPVT